MIPGKYDITIYRGSTWSIGLGAKDVNLTPTDFQAAYIDTPTVGLGSARMHIRPAWAAKPGVAKAAPLLELTTANGRIVINNVLITLTISAEDTAALEFNSGKYDIELVTGDDVPVVHKLLYGTVTVKDEKTV